MGQALYRKNRPKAFGEVVGQDHIVRTLQNALKSGRINHAYLFSGPRGVGKTSMARILAHEVNGLDYKDESIHLDIIEIDAASNRRIDEIRDLRERVHIAPTSAKYKVYIIDEAHMLTREAFNALLKTLEEPPAHCIFILATTEAHKLPETIISRTQRFNFKSIDSSPAVHHLEAIAKEEKIDITPKALELLAEHGSGSFRDSIGLLDQLSSLGTKIDEAQVRELLGLPPATKVVKILDCIKTGNTAELASSLDELKQQGANFALLAKALNQPLRQMLIDGQADKWVAKLLRRLSAVAGSANPQELLEIDLLEVANANSSAGSVKEPIKVPRTPVEPPPPEEPEEPAEDAEHNTERPPKVKTAKSAAFDLKFWPEVINKVKSEAASLYTALRLAEPRLSDNYLTLAFQFPLHQKKVAQAKNVEILGRIIEEVSGARLNIKTVLDRELQLALPKKAPDKQPEAESPASLQTINNIFGSGEVLES